MKRNLDGIYFRIGTENFCFSDLTEEQQDEILKDKDVEWLKRMCKILTYTIKAIGDEFDIVCG